MTSEDKNESADVAENVGEGSEQSQADTISVSKKDWESTNQTLGSLKRQLKDLQKSKEETKTPEQNQKPDDKVMERIERLALKSENITHPDDVELARSLAKKWNTDIDSVIADEDFKAKLTRQQNTRSNAEATSNLKGGAGTSQAKLTTGYWQAKGTPPTRADIPNRKDRVAIIREMMKNARTSGKKFYND